MRVLLRITLVSSLMVWCAFAQRGGHGGGGGGFHGGGGGSHAAIGGGGTHTGGGFAGGRSIGGGVRGGVGSYGFNRGGAVFGGFNRGYGYGFRGGYWPYWGWGYPWYGYGYGLSYWPWYNDYWNYPGYGSGYGYDPGAYSYNSSPNVTVVYPQTVNGDPPPAYAQTAHPVTRSYDQYGQEMHPPANGAPASPIYLIATKDGAIQAASSYWVENGTLHYVTLQREEKTVLLNSIDRTLTNQLNRERRVNLNLGQ